MTYCDRLQLHKPTVKKSTAFSDTKKVTAEKLKRASLDITMAKVRGFPQCAGEGAAIKLASPVLNLFLETSCDPQNWTLEVQYQDVVNVLVRVAVQRINQTILARKDFDMGKLVVDREATLFSRIEAKEEEGVKGKIEFLVRHIGGHMGLEYIIMLLEVKKPETFRLGPLQLLAEMYAARTENSDADKELAAGMHGILELSGDDIGLTQGEDVESALQDINDSLASGSSDLTYDQRLHGVVTSYDESQFWSVEDTEITRTGILKGWKPLFCGIYRRLHSAATKIAKIMAGEWSN